jgi:hypothetical protein
LGKIYKTQWLSTGDEYKERFNSGMIMDLDLIVLCIASFICGWLVAEVIKIWLIKRR